MDKDRPHLVLFMTWDVSLALWREKGLLQREVRLYQRLAAQGVEVTFLSWGGAEDDEIAKSLEPAIKTVSLYKHIPRPKNKALRALCSLLAPWKVKGTLKAADIYKTNQMWGGWVAALARALYFKPLVARCGYELYDFTIRQGHGWPRRFFIRMISDITYGAAALICVATQEDKDFIMKEFKEPERRIAVHPNWIDTDFFRPGDGRQKENSLLFAGRLTAQKNLEMLIEALAGTGFTLTVAGEGELREKLEKRAQETGVKTDFKGSVPNDEMPALYSAHPVFILPSHYEGNPKALLEAMACGCAVIGTDAPGIKSVIKNEVSGLLCRPDAVSIREAAERLMGDKTLRARLGAAARKQIVQNQTLDRLVAMELACYQSLLEKPGR